jgi:hypothetical protein
MESVTSVVKAEHIRNRRVRQKQLTLRQEARLLVLTLQKPRFAGVGLPKNQVTDGPKASIAPRFDKLLNARPAVETEDQAILLENAMGFDECRLQPRITGVVLESAPCAVAEVQEIRRVSEN